MPGEPEALEGGVSDDDGAPLPGPCRAGSRCSPAAPRNGGPASARPAAPAFSPRPVATRAPGPSSERPTAHERVPRIGPSGHRHDLEARPGAGLDGRSFAEWTATSARPSSSACSTSFTKTPWPPSSPIGTSRRRSPAVCTTTSSVVDPPIAGAGGVWPRPARRPRARPGASASGLPRVATRSVSTGDPRGRTGCARPRRGARRGASPPLSFRRTVGSWRSLAIVRWVTDSTIWRASGSSASRRGTMAVELRLPDRLGSGPQRRHDRGGRPPRRQDPVPVELLEREPPARPGSPGGASPSGLRRSAARPPRRAGGRRRVRATAGSTSRGTATSTTSSGRSGPRAHGPPDACRVEHHLGRRRSR